MLAFGVPMRDHSGPFRSSSPDRSHSADSASGGRTPQDDRRRVRADEPGDGANVGLFRSVLQLLPISGGDPALVQALPLTAVNDALRATMLEGATLAQVTPELAIVAAWMVGTFAIALRIFRWQ